MGSAEGGVICHIQDLQHAASIQSPGAAGPLRLSSSGCQLILQAPAQLIGQQHLPCHRQGCIRCSPMLANRLWLAVNDAALDTR